MNSGYDWMGYSVQIAQENNDCVVTVKGDPEQHRRRFSGKITRNGIWGLKSEIDHGYSYFSNIHKSYGETKVLKGIDIQVQDGEFLVLVGPSGCGKSTLLKCLAGLNDITAGEIKIGDRIVNDIPPRDRDVAMVFQSYALYPHMTVAENMGFALKLRKEPTECHRQSGQRSCRNA